MEIIIPPFVVAMQCKAYQHCIAISTLPKICTTLHAALTTHIWYVYSTYNYLSGTCRPKRSYAAHMPHIMLIGYVSRPWCSRQWSRLRVYVCGEVRQCWYLLVTIVLIFHKQILGQTNVSVCTQMDAKNSWPSWKAAYY